MASASIFLCLLFSFLELGLLPGGDLRCESKTEGTDSHLHRLAGFAGDLGNGKIAGVPIIILRFKGQGDPHILAIKDLGRQSAALASVEQEAGIIVVGESDLAQISIKGLGAGGVSRACHDDWRSCWLAFDGIFMATGRQKSGQKDHYTRSYLSHAHTLKSAGIRPSDK